MQDPPRTRDEHLSGVFARCPGSLAPRRINLPSPRSPFDPSPIAPSQSRGLSRKLRLFAPGPGSLPTKTFGGTPHPIACPRQGHWAAPLVGGTAPKRFTFSVDKYVDDFRKTARNPAGVRGCRFCLHFAQITKNCLISIRYYFSRQKSGIRTIRAGEDSGHTPAPGPPVVSGG